MRTSYNAQALISRKLCETGPHNNMLRIAGDPWPSDDDITTTAEIQRAARIVGIPLADHVIVTRDPNRYHSMSAHGTMATEADD